MSYVRINKTIKNTFTIGNYELDEIAPFAISIITVYVFQKELKLGIMILILYGGYKAMLWLHKLKATKVKSFKSHLKYYFGFLSLKFIPQPQNREFFGS